MCVTEFLLNGWVYFDEILCVSLTEIPNNFDFSLGPGRWCFNWFQEIVFLVIFNIEKTFVDRTNSNQANVRAEQRLENLLVFKDFFQFCLFKFLQLLNSIFTTLYKVIYYCNRKVIRFLNP